MPEPEPTRVLLVDASQLVTEGLRISLHRTQAFRVVGIAHNAADALRCLRGVLVDLVVTDIDVPGGGPLATVRHAAAHRPGAPVAVLSGVDSPQWARAALDEGASAYLLKTTPLHELLPALANTARGAEPVIDPRLGAGAGMPPELPPRSALGQLSAREFDVLVELVKGLDNQMIAAKLFISTDTVKTHVKAILRKLAARDRAHAVALVLGAHLPGAVPDPLT